MSQLAILRRMIPSYKKLLPPRQTEVAKDNIDTVGQGKNLNTVSTDNNGENSHYETAVVEENDSDKTSGDAYCLILHVLCVKYIYLRQLFQEY